MAQQYIAAQQAGDFKQALEFVEKQTDLLIELYGENNSRVCSNALLKAQF